MYLVWVLYLISVFGHLLSICQLVDLIRVDGAKGFHRRHLSGLNCLVGKDFNPETLGDLRDPSDRDSGDRVLLVLLHERKPSWIGIVIRRSRLEIRSVCNECGVQRGIPSSLKPVDTHSGRAATNL